MNMTCGNCGKAMPLPDALHVCAPPAPGEHDIHNEACGCVPMPPPFTFAPSVPGERMSEERFDLLRCKREITSDEGSEIFSELSRARESEEVAWGRLAAKGVLLRAKDAELAALRAEVAGLEDAMNARGMSCTPDQDLTRWKNRAERAEAERDQQERFKWAANERADKAEADASRLRAIIEEEPHRWRCKPFRNDRGLANAVVMDGVVCKCLKGRIYRATLRGEK